MVNKQLKKCKSRYLALAFAFLNLVTQFLKAIDGFHLLPSRCNPGVWFGNISIESIT